MTKEIEGCIQIILSVEFCQINHNNETFYQGLSFNSFTVFLMQMDIFFCYVKAMDFNYSPRLYMK